MVPGPGDPASGPRTACRHFSGGNQQKLVLAKALATRPRLLLLAEPTRGVDVAARQEIYALLATWAREGVAQIVSSGDTEELLLLCHRIFVFRKGRVVAEFHPRTAARRWWPMLWARLRPEFLARYGLVWALGILVLVLSLLSPYFLTPSNLLNILRQVSINAILALGMTVVILKGGIDLSVGSLLALAGAMAAGLAIAGLSPVLAMGLGIGVAIALGVLQGLLVAYAGLPPFIVTLAGLTAFRGSPWSTPTAGLSPASLSPFSS